MAKFCTKCGYNLPDEAKYCANCGTKLGFEDGINRAKRKNFPVWAIVLIIFGCLLLIPIIFFTISFIIGYNLIKDSGVIDEIKDEVNNYIDENIGSNVVGTISDTLTDNEIKITLNNTYKYDNINDIDKSAEGKEYLLFFFEVENISDENQFISYFDFDGYADGTATEIRYISNEVDGQSNLTANIAVGSKANGFVAFEIDKSWKKFEIHCNRNAFKNKDDLIFEVENVD